MNEWMINHETVLSLCWLLPSCLQLLIHLWSFKNKWRDIWVAHPLSALDSGHDPKSRIIPASSSLQRACSSLWFFMRGSTRERHHIRQLMLMRAGGVGQKTIPGFILLCSPPPPCSCIGRVNRTTSPGQTLIPHPSWLLQWVRKPL